MDKTIESYNQTAEEYAAATAHLHQADMAKSFFDNIDGNKILDLACSSGRDIRPLSEKGQVIGIDLAEKLVEIARSNNPGADVRVMDLRTMDFTNGYFDGVWACAAYVHLPKTQFLDALKETRRVLSPSGTLFIAMKEGDEEGYVADQRFGGVEKYWALYGKDELESLLQRAGFKILRTHIQEKDDPHATHRWLRYICTCL
jgi:SAM-dependent methyltransferase